MSFEEETEEEEHAGPSQADLLASYLAFAGRAIRNRALTASLIFVVAGVLTAAVVVLWPRTYHCEMKLVTQRTEMLNTRGSGEGFRAAAEAIMRRENLENIVKQTELVKN